jgi:hypothetical protein
VVSTGEQTGRVTVGSDSVQGNVKLGKPVWVLGQKLVPCCLNGLASVGRERMKIVRGDCNVVE